MTTATSIVQRLLEDDFEADLKRYTNAIHKSSNLDAESFEYWLRRKGLRIRTGDQDLHTFWNTSQYASGLLRIADEANVPRKKLVLAACACARLALKYIPVGEERPLRAIEAAEAWARGEATLDEAYRLADEAADVSADYPDTAAAANAAANAAYATSASHLAAAAANDADYAGVDRTELSNAIRSVILAIELRPKL